MIASHDEARILALLRGPAPDRERGLRELHEHTRKALFGLALRITGRPELADDAVQEAYVDVVRGIGGFRGEAKLTTWLYRITLRAAMRVAARGHRKVEALPDELVDRRAGPAASAASRDSAARILAALAALPAPQRAVLALNALKGLPQTEIAQILGVPEGTVHSRLHAAREQLRRTLKHG